VQCAARLRVCSLRNHLEPVKAAILFSGGIDSAALASWKRPDLAITVDYGQASADAELRAASIIAVELGIRHETFRIDLGKFGTGAMANRPQLPIAPSPEWWPFRNQFLITLAAMFSIREGFDELLIGTVLSDNLHADGSATFIQCVDALISLQEGNLRLRAPAAQMKSTELVRVSGLTPALLAWCHSCHRGNLACGKCRGCDKNRQVRNAVGLVT
jgi:7-cyano-7-deazaguanine synthase